MLFPTALNIINGSAVPRRRGAELSLLYFTAYLVQGCFAFGIGALATAWTLEGAVTIACLTIAARRYCGLDVGCIRPKHGTIAAHEVMRPLDRIGTSRSLTCDLLVTYYGGMDAVFRALADPTRRELLDELFVRTARR